MGEDDQYEMIRIETGEMVSVANGIIVGSPHSLVISERLQPLAAHLNQALKEYGFELLEAEQVNQPLPFETTIPTILREPGEYLVMDAVFLLGGLIGSFIK